MSLCSVLHSFLILNELQRQHCHRGVFHEGVGREGLACRYEQTMETDGSGVATVLPGPRCSLPPGWRPRPINPKLCHSFSSLWIQKRSREGCFTGFLAQLHTCNWTCPCCISQETAGWKHSVRRADDV